MATRDYVVSLKVRSSNDAGSATSRGERGRVGGGWGRTENGFYCDVCRFRIFDLSDLKILNVVDSDLVYVLEDKAFYARMKR